MKEGFINEKDKQTMNYSMCKLNKQKLILAPGKVYTYLVTVK